MNTTAISSKEEFRIIGEKARAASILTAKASSEAKNRALLILADLLLERKEALFEANQKDLIRGEADGLSAAFLDRLRISEKVLAQMSEGLRQITSLADPIGGISDMRAQPSGIMIGQMRVPLGVIGIIYESRPNVTIDAAALCLKSGNACILRGGSDAIESNRFLADLIAEALEKAELPADAVQVIRNPDRALVAELITSPEYVDILIPRGGKSLIARINAEAKVPMIKHLDGICHTYVEAGADRKLAVRVTDNAKTQRPSPCNATETLLVDKAIAEVFLPEIAAVWVEKGVEMRCDETSYEILAPLSSELVTHAAEDDWSTEYNALVISIKVVEGIDEAIRHINTYGSHHTDAIITTNLEASQRFMREVDSASVMVNTSTRFADGFEYGLGAEIGISTDKLHARGPVGLNGLTSLKYVVLGHGEIRK